MISVVDTANLLVHGNTGEEGNDNAVGKQTYKQDSVYVFNG